MIMEASEALQELIKTIQTGDNYIEEYELMLIRFMDSQDDGDTVRMSFEFAKQELTNIKLTSKAL
jgi:hypothetical protein